MSALARWCFRHRLTVAGAWATVLLALGGFVAVSGTSFVDAFSLPHTDSTKALDLLTTTMPGQSGDRECVRSFRLVSVPCQGRPVCGSEGSSCDFVGA